ncbi:hypothetical protein BH23PLA1_BH23PLA1_45170 [soil metagenome]
MRDQTGSGDRARWLLIALLFLVLPLSTSRAQVEGIAPRFEQEPPEDEAQPGRMALRADRTRMGFAGPSPPPPQVESRPIEKGYVFLNGEYLAPPYRLRQQGEEITINDRPVPTLESSAEERPDRRSGWGRQESPSRGLAFRLEAGDVLFILDNGQVDFVSITSGGMEPLPHLTASATEDRSSEALTALIDQMPGYINRSAWRDWLQDYVPPQEFLDRARADLATFEAILADNESHISGYRQLESLSYPMTVLGMVLAVLALGHLISCRPDALDPIHRDNLEAGIQGRVGRTIALIVVLSGFDLAWTILAWQGGQMRELNPLGSQLIEDTSALIAFKGSATIVSAGLFFALHRHRSARIASWWVCLICTVLAFRWLTFNSMFIS